MTFYAPLPLAVPLAIAAILAGLNRHIPKRWSSMIALATTAANIWFCIVLLSRSMSYTEVYWFGGWRPRGGIALGISFVIDPIGAAFACLAGVLTLAALLFSAKYFDSIGTMFHVLMLVFLGAMCGFSLTGDLFNLFVFFELMSAAAYGLCGYKTEEAAAVQGSLNFAITNTVGCYFILTGIGLLYARTGALNMAQIGRALDHHPSDPLIVAAFTFLVCGFFVKAAIVPFHFWLADAHAVAPSPVCVLFSGVMVELGLYAVARIYWVIFSGTFSSHVAALRALFLVIGTATALLGGAMCFGQRNLKRLLAFSTISHMGLMVIGFGLLNPVGLAAAAFYILGHAGAKGGLFLCAGIILHRCESVDELELHGRTRVVPFAIGALVLGAAALAGTPGSGASLGDSLAEAAGRSHNYEWITWIATASGILTSAAILRFGARTYFGWGPALPKRPAEPKKIPEHPETTAGHQRTPAVMFVPALALVLTGLLSAFTPGLENGVLRAASRFEDHAAYLDRVLDNAAVPAGNVLAVPRESMVHGFVTIAGAFALAFLYLRWERGRHSLTAAAKAVQVVRNAHSGHVGDYVVWLTFGFAAFGLAALFLLR